MLSEIFVNPETSNEYLRGMLGEATLPIIQLVFQWSLARLSLLPYLRSVSERARLAPARARSLGCSFDVRKISSRAMPLLLTAAPTRSS